jgi:predicted PolB exonuclease-like 3'-5' exonuclease
MGFTDPILVFDIETIPDVRAGRKILDLKDATDAEVAEAMYAARREKTKGSDFLQVHLHQIVAISAVLRVGDKPPKVWSMGTPDSDEAEIIGRFFAGVEKHHPILVSWNGSGFDLPVLNFRAMRHRVSANGFWDTAGNAKWNNYHSRYGGMTLDLMDVLSRYQSRAATPLTEVAQLYGWPGKMGMDGSKVWPAFQEGRIEEIRNYCETDVLNTYGVLLMFELFRGHISEETLDAEIGMLRNELAASGKPHLLEFMEAMPKSGSLFDS